MYKLYGRPGSGSVAPQILLEELGLSHELHWVDPTVAQGAEYRRLNPTGKVPALVLPDGTAMFESGAMVIHLTDCHPSALAPRPGTPAHAKYLQWMVYLSSTLYETYLRYYYSDRYSSGGMNDAPRVKERAASDLVTAFGVLEDGLHPYLLGAEISAADLYLFMLSTWYHPSADALYRSFPRLGALAKIAAARPAVAKVMAANA